MKYYPILMDIKDRDCLVVGGGSVGFRKAMGLLKAHARVQVVSPWFHPDLEAAAKGNTGLTLVQGKFTPKDLGGKCLVFAATDDMELNGQIREAARNAGILCNAADGHDKGDFILPAVVDRGDVLTAVSTCGASPALAKDLRKKLERLIGPEYDILAGLLAKVRVCLLAQGHDPSGHKAKLTALVKSDLLEKIALDDPEQIQTILSDVLGQDLARRVLSGEEE